MTVCQYGCGTELKWDKQRKSESGKMIPIEVSTNEPHNCPKSPYNTGKQGGSTQTTMDGSGDSSLASRVPVLDAEVKSLKEKLE